MSDWRLSRGRYLLAWAAITAVQLGPVFLGVALEPALMGAWICAVQLLKIPLAIGRTNDLGRAPDDAVIGTIVPFANLYFFFAILLGATPKEARREKLTARWKGQPSWYSAAAPAVRLMGATAGVGLLSVLALSLPQVWVLHQLEAAVPTWPAWGPETLEQRFSIVAGIAGFLGLYTMIQLGKRQKATPASWIPSVFFLPLAMLAGAIYAMSIPDFATLTPLHVGLVTIAFVTAWHSLVGAAVVMAWTVAADAASRGEDASLGAVWSRVKARFVAVMPAHAGRVQLVWLGAQVIVPGLFYWVYAAFVVPAGTLEDPPDHPLTTRSGKLTWGMMSRLVKLCLVYIVMVAAAQSLVLFIHGPAVATAVLFSDLSQVPMSTQILIEVLGNTALWWVTVVITLLYRARVGQLEERRREREASQEAGKTAIPEADSALEAPAAG